MFEAAKKIFPSFPWPDCGMILVMKQAKYTQHKKQNTKLVTIFSKLLIFIELPSACLPWQ
jgi:hypothetical protein